MADMLHACVAPAGQVPGALAVGRRRVVRRVLAAGRIVGRGALEARMLAAALATGVLDALEIGVVRRGRVGMPDGASLVVANHVSWLDACVVQAVLPGRIVVGAEEASWPVLGTICRGFEAIVVRPGDVLDVRRTVSEIATALCAGERVVVFPEGAPTDGQRVGRFHAALLQAAIDTGAPVQPVALRWLGLGGRPTSAVTRAGERRRGASLGGVLAAPYLRVAVCVGTPLSVAGRSRRELAVLAREFVATSLGVPPAASGDDGPVASVPAAQASMA
jgi:1-acyl-sn-glycerol-3-phosphate acyltransferase